MIDSFDGFPTDRGLTDKELVAIRDGLSSSPVFICTTYQAAMHTKRAVESGRDSGLAGRLLQIEELCRRFVFASASLAGASPVACSRGCYYCCTYLVVCASHHEAVAIAERVLSTYGPDEMARLDREIDEYEARTEGLSHKEWNKVTVRCPFLVDGCCSVYDIRPMACRRYHSQSADFCRREAESPFLVPVEPVQNVGINNAFSFVHAGIAYSLRKFGVPYGTLDMLRAVRRVLSNPKLITSWWRRPDAFDDLETLTFYPGEADDQPDDSGVQIIDDALDQMLFPKPDRSHRPPAPADRKKKRNRKLAHAR